MTQKLLLPVVTYDEFQGLTRKYVAKVRMSDLRKIDFPLNANVRRPTRNYVVNNILDSISKKQGTMLIESPIFVVCNTASLVLSHDRSTHLIEMTFTDWQGVLDGGHRLLASRLANLDRGTYDTDNVFLHFQIEVGLSKEATGEKAISLNTSKNPAAYELANFRGEFDWFKELVADSHFKYIQYYSGQLQGGFEGDPALNIKILTILPQIVDPRYDPHVLGASPKKRHPMFLSSSSSGGSDSFLDMLRANKSRFASSNLMVDLLELYCEIYRLVDSRHFRKKLPFIAQVNDSRKATHLPDGTILSFKHPARFYVLPILSCFRLLLTDQFEWKEYPLANIVRSRRFIDKLITVMTELMSRRDRAQSTVSILYRDVDIWDRLYARAEKALVEEFGIEVKKAA